MFYLQRPSIPRYLLILLVFILGLMAKPMLVTFPFMLLLFDYWPLKRFKINSTEKGSTWKLLREKIPFFILFMVFSIVAYFVQKKGGAVQSFESYHFGIRIANAIVSYVSYLAKFFWPADLAIFYPHPRRNISIPLVITSGIFLLCGSWLILHFRRRYPYLLMGWLWYLITLLPVIGLIQIGSHAMADRFTYIPLIGIFIMLAWGIPDLLQRYLSAPKIFAFLAMPAIAVCSLRTYTQVGYWQNDFTVFSHAIDIIPNNAPAFLCLGNSLIQNGHPNEGLKLILEAVNINQTNLQTYESLAIAYNQTGQLEKSAALYKELLKANPDSPNHNNGFADVLCKQNKFNEAISHHRRAIRAEPDNPLYHGNLAYTLYKKGDYPAAWKEFHLAQKGGLVPTQDFLQNLSAKMPEPRD